MSKGPSNAEYLMTKKHKCLTWIYRPTLDTQYGYPTDMNQSTNMNQPTYSKYEHVYCRVYNPPLVGFARV